MKDETALVGAAVGALSLVAAGVALIFRAAFRVGVESRTNERIASDLAEIKVQLRGLVDQHATQHHDVMLRVVALEGRVNALERQSRPDIGE